MSYKEMQEKIKNIQKIKNRLTLKMIAFHQKRELRGRLNRRIYGN